MLGCALLFSYVEFLIPLPVSIPGFKLGLANIITYLLMEKYGIHDAVTVSLLRVLLSSVLFGSITGLLFSAGGCVFSVITLYLLFRPGCEKFSHLCRCICSAAAHNLGQIIAAAILYGVSSSAFYLPYLLLVSVPCGILTGVIVTILIRHTRPV